MNKPMFCYFMRNMRILIDKALKLFHVWSCINITASQVICTTIKMYKHTYLHMCKHNQRSKNTEYAIRSVWQFDNSGHKRLYTHYIASSIKHVNSSTVTSRVTTEGLCHGLWSRLTCNLNYCQEVIKRIHVCNTIISKVIC